MDSSISLPIETEWEKAIISYLQSSYWDSDWKIKTPPTLTRITFQLKQQSTSKNTRPKVSLSSKSLSRSKNSNNHNNNNNNNNDIKDNKPKKIFPLIANIPSFVFSVFILFTFLVYAYLYKKSLISNCFRKRTN